MRQATLDPTAQSQSGMARSRRMVAGLSAPGCYPHPVGRISTIETHISFVLLTGTFAYKIKKPVDLGFLDFTTLEKRLHFCREELRLNQRLAPDIYLDVVPICGTPEAPTVGSGTAVIDYAVKMVEFPQGALADRMLARGELSARDIDALAAQVAAFHERAARCPEGEDYGGPERLRASVMQNFAQIRAANPPWGNLPRLEKIEKWTIGEHERLREEFATRKRAGRVRECHGDLHLGNIAFLNGKPRLFDCIEFNPALRWIDISNEVAFLVMDLLASGHERLARRFLNANLEGSGDYEGLRTLRYFLVYRAMVRAKICLMRAGQLSAGEAELARAQEQFGRYLELALACCSRARGFVAITHGLSGSGKTTLSQTLAELTGAIRLRSDVERKRMLAGSIPAARGPAVASGLYAADATQATYRRLLELAGEVIDSGYGVIVDATFLRRSHRDLFRSWAAAAQVPFAIIDFTASEALLRSRIEARQRQGNDASDADLRVLEHQFATQEALQADELACTFAWDASRSAHAAELPGSWGSLLEFLQRLRA